METYNLNLDSHWQRILSTKPEHGMGYQKADIYFKDGTILHNIVILNGELVKNVSKDIIQKEVKHIHVLESINNDEEENKKGNIIMDEKQHITKFIKNLMDDDYAEANKTLIDITDSKVQELIKNEIVAQETEKTA